MNSLVNILQSEIIDTYLSTILSTEQATHNERRILNLWTVRRRDWDRVNLDHPCTFEKLAMFNYLRLDVYDLQLATIADDAMLRDLMLKIKNKSILVIKDIDFSIGLPSRSLIGGDEDEEGDVKYSMKTRKMSLSGLLNFIDGIWSSCGDKRIIIFTTNHKDRLDQALLRPRHMDVHINMSYLSMPTFKILVTNYLLVEDYLLFREIEKLKQQGVQITPSQIREELTRSVDAASDIALQWVIAFLKGKKRDPTHEQDAIKEVSDHEELSAIGVEKSHDIKEDVKKN